jgi:cellulose synthase/poly-beta-1,6-N-acetylglucosamine synthase-like glycosyltransferase
MRPVTLIFVIVCILYVYPYTIYPLILSLLCRLAPPRPGPRSPPEVRASHIICAHNEEAHIEQKLMNAFDAVSRIPHEVVLVCDGCTDKTVEMALKVARKHPDLRIVDTPHVGKSAAQSLGAGRATGQVFVFSDADTLLAEDTVERLLKALKGGYACVGANVQFGQEETPASLYNRLEARLKTCQGRLGKLIGVHGACYAVWRETFRRHDSSVLSDLALPLDLLYERRSVGFEPNAIAYELSERTDFLRNLTTRRRIFCRALATLLGRGYVTRFLSKPGLFFHLVSDKLPRYFIGVFSIVVLILAILAGGWVLMGMVVLILVLAAAAPLGDGGDRPDAMAKLSAASSFFIIVNISSLLALSDFISGRDYSKW